MLDDRNFREALPMITGWTYAEICKAFNQAGPAFLSGGSIDELAGKSRIDAIGLNAIIPGYNYGVSAANDLFGCVRKPLPVVEPPLRTIRIQASAISRAVGLAADDIWCVIRQDGSPIPNLYTAGEILGSGQAMGNASCGGIMVTPVMTSGRLIGQSLIPLSKKQVIQ